MTKSIDYADQRVGGALMDGELHLTLPIRAKYFLDRILAFGLALAFLPLGIVIAVWVALDSLLSGERLQIFVTERRFSAGRTFPLLKFRILRLSALERHKESPDVRSIKALETAEHLTRVGRVLKRFYLDELPQLFNIARGHMSLVGPRPYFEGDWEREPKLDIPARRVLKAGLVGPFQAVKGRVSGLESVNDLDTEYFQFALSASLPKLLLRDLEVIFRSIRTVAEGKGL